MRNQLESIIADYNRGDFNAALASASTLIAEFAVLHNVLGAIHARQGNQQAAVKHFLTAVESNPKLADAYNNLGVALKSLGRHEEAIENYVKAIEIKPDYTEAHFNLANSYRDLGRREDAAAKYLEAVRLEPYHLGARNNLGIVLNSLERYEEAVGHFSKVIRANPKFSAAYNNLGLALKQLGREEEAQASFARAIESKPFYAEAHYNWGNLLFDLGRKEEALSKYNGALKIKPDFAEVYRSMGPLKRYQENDLQLAQMRQMIARENISDDDRMHLHYALGKACEDLEDRESAFNHYSQGNQLRKKFLRYSPDVERNLFRNMKSAFADAGPRLALDEPSMEQLPQAPVFIVGMPRSGTSLTEHILSCHSQVFGGGELMTLGKAVTGVWSAGCVQPDQLKAIRETYLAKMMARGVDERYITDKMHMNYRLIGFICTAFPGAKIVHIKRRSIASCWSIFKYYFSDFGNGYAYDLEDIAEYYQGYMDLMAFWKERFPGAIYDLSYERLTEDQETETRNLLAHLGLDFEQSCIDFHESHRAVATISSMQVRRKLYKGSSDEWRKYEKFLGPLIERLGTE
ncbi:tetratricopeptide repeat-containing sulfotransferase family protein [Hyphococcus sp.]|uniref:tetratricopeptide repeat-containing sulfotransferase family protein n=1 Tax=Hyphococcus sp. TaxID=2038636 RepID=UPI00208BF6CB|nr:MAG: sulfotransferase [Marinicaulis sp.]